MLNLNRQKLKRIVFVAYGALVAVLLVCLFAGAVFRADADSYYDEESNKTIRGRYAMGGGSSGGGGSGGSSGGGGGGGGSRGC